MADPTLQVFGDPRRHQNISDIIRRHSTNRADVRDVFLAGLDLSRVKEVLDLGCGFGFTTQALAPRLAPDAAIVGVDACARNEAPFLETVSRSARRARFVHRRLEKRLDWPDRSFDLVVASYALYFFPQLLPEMARVLRPDGLLLAVTHTEASCRDLLRAAGLVLKRSPLLGVIQRFSAENADQLLRPHFGAIERVDYVNQLVFQADEFDDFLTYLRFKLPLLLPDSEPGGELPRPLADAIRKALAGRAAISFQKDDAAFRCRGPRCHQRLGSARNAPSR